jgi:hypothetical protein
MRDGRMVQPAQVLADPRHRHPALPQFVDYLPASDHCPLRGPEEHYIWIQLVRFGRSLDRRADFRWAPNIPPALRHSAAP